MKGTPLTLSTGTVVTLGLRGNSIVAHATGKTQAANKGAIMERPVDVAKLAAELGLTWAMLPAADQQALATAVGRVS